MTEKKAAPRFAGRISPREAARRAEVKQRLLSAARCPAPEALGKLGSAPEGLSEDEVGDRRGEFGANVVTRGKKKPLWRRIFEAFASPFTAILIVIAVVTAFTDVILPGKTGAEGNGPATLIIITAMVLISGVLRFVQETRSGNAAARLSAMIRTTACVRRKDAGEQEIPLDEIVVGDIIVLAAGDIVPADVRVLEAKDLFVNQAALTGESEPVEKRPDVCQGSVLTDLPCLAFMGTTVVSGSARCVAAAVGDDTMLGEVAGAVSAKPPKTTFEKGVNSVSVILIRFMLIMVPVVFLTNGLTKGDWMGAALFAVSVAVGLTPEMLPMLVTTCLARGAVAMSHKKVIIKNLNAIQNLGSMDVLCTDKTGTLTRNEVVLEYHLDIMGNEDVRVLRHAFLNSFYETGLRNLIDLAIIRKVREEAGGDGYMGLDTRYTKVDEIPFDFDRRRMSVVVADQSGKTQMITKGALEEMLRVSSFAEFGGKAEPLTEERRALIREKAAELNRKGMRVIAVAQKTNPSPVGQFSVADEKDMVLIGYLAFLDPPKETTAAAIRALRASGVTVKVLTGDNETVAASICGQVGLPESAPVLGSEVDAMDDAELTRRAERAVVFARLSPAQKARVVSVLREAGHCVGYMGDGINDAAAMRASDVGISVDTAVDTAKESASVILLEKDLMVLEQGIVEGRKTYANMIKYIKMTASSNFGNMLSVMTASAFLPFLPMQSIHLLLLNMIYDFSCIALPWDNVDPEALRAPRRWDASSVTRFMLCMGPASSVFDIATYALLYFIVCPARCGGALFRELADPAARSLYVSVFQAGWFVESMWSQTLIIHMLRTPKIPFLQSRASAPVTLVSFAGMAALTVIPFTSVGAALGLAPLPPVYFAWLFGIVLCYMLLATLLKKIYVRKYGELL